MDRRVFMGRLALATLALPRATVAQPARTMFRIGILSSRYSTSDVAGSQPSDPHAGALLRGLRELGYVYGQHFVTEARGAEGKPDRFPKIAAELVRLAVDVIVAGGPMLPYIKQATSTIPVAMAGVGDAVQEGMFRASDDRVETSRG